IDFDGLLTGSNLEGLGKPQRAYVRVFRTGSLESVISSLAKGRDSHSLILPHLQALIIKYSSLYAQALASAGIAPPYGIACSLVGVQNVRLLQDFIPTGAYVEDLPNTLLRQDRYDFSEATIDAVPEAINDCAKRIKKLLDHVAN